MKANIIHDYPEKDYCEIEQPSKIKFSIASRDKNDFYLLYQPFKCKDYLTEVWLARRTGIKPQEVYGFSVDKIWEDKYLYLYISGTSTEIKNLIDNFGIIYNLEDLLGIKESSRSRFYLTKEKGIIESLIIRFPKEWIHAAILLSLYTLALRTLTIKTNVSYDSYKDFLITYFNTHGHYQETELTKQFYTTRFNLDIFLKNYKKIIGKNPITGYDDKVFISNFVYKGLLRFSNQLDDYTPTLHWSSITGHNLSGIYTLSKSINNGLEKALTIGHIWAKNYLLIVK